MKVLFSCSLPFFLAHGGQQTLMEALMRELAGLGVEVEPERWWDQNQTGDIIHYVSRAPIDNVLLAKKKGFKIVMTEFLDQTASRSRPQLFAQRLLINLARAALPHGFTARLSWDSYQNVDALGYAVQHEWETAQYLFRAKAGLGHIIPHGMEMEAQQQLARPQAEEDYLISAATIHPRKNSLLLAQAALQAATPIVFLGKPYAENDPYFLEFKKCVDGRVVRYPGFVSTEEKFRYLRGARGFALLSQFESGCISVYEAAAAGLPFLLSDLPWASKVYGDVPAARFVRLGTPAAIAPALKAFYLNAHRQPGPTFPLLTWRQVAEKYLAVYQSVLSRS